MICKIKIKYIMTPNDQTSTSNEWPYLLLSNISGAI